MSSMRVLEKIVDELVGTHCLVEWEEEGHPRNVLERKRVVEGKKVGEMCSVRLVEKSKSVQYSAKLLGCGKHSIRL